MRRAKDAGIVPDSLRRKLTFSDKIMFLDYGSFEVFLSNRFLTRMVYWNRAWNSLKHLDESDMSSSSKIQTQHVDGWLI